MDKNRFVKLKGPSSIKKATIPKDFNSLMEKVQEFIQLEGPNQRYQLIDEKGKREITNQEDFEKMSNEYLNENIIKITINIIDKKSEFILPNMNKKIDNNTVTYESKLNLLGKNIEEKKNAENEEDNIVQNVLKQKMKELEDKLVEELYKNIQNEIEKSKIKNNEEEKEEIKEDINIGRQIHRGIVCNKCGKENIEGIRYKCAQCANFNLCQKCEKNYNHDIKHIMIKIRYALKNDNELISKINRNISYKNQDMNYNLEPKIFNLDGTRDIDVQQVNIKNIGAAPWRGVYLKCIEDKSEIIGDEYEINYNANSGSMVKASIQFSDLKNQLKPGKKTYICFFQMFNGKNESFGNVTKVKVNIKN